MQMNCLVSFTPDILVDLKKQSSQVGLSTGTSCRVITRDVKFRPGTRVNVNSMSILTEAKLRLPCGFFCAYIVARKQIIKCKILFQKYAVKYI